MWEARVEDSENKSTERSPVEGSDVSTQPPMQLEQASAGEARADPAVAVPVQIALVAPPADVVSAERPGAPEVAKDEVLLEALVLGDGVLPAGSTALDEKSWAELQQRFGPDVAVILVREDTQQSEGGDVRRRPFSILTRIVIRMGTLAFNQFIRPQIQGALPFGGAGLGLLG